MTDARIVRSKISGSLRVPPSKSYTHRALVLASLAEGVSTVRNPLISGDTLATIRACEQMGARMVRGASSLEISGCKPRTPEDILNVENSGTTLRVMTALAGLVEAGYTVLTGDESIRSRPMQPLLDSLHDLGVDCYSTRGNGRAPIVVKGGGIKGGRTSITGKVSSQFVSALIIAATRALDETEICVEDTLVSRPYVGATLSLLQRFGGTIEADRYSRFKIPPEQALNPADFEVPGDFSSASFILAAAAMTGGEAAILNANFDLPQADLRIVQFLGRMGAETEVNRSNSFVRVRSSAGLSGGTFDLSDSPDLLPVMGVLALKAGSEVELRGVGHTKFKETDRMAVLGEALSKLGAIVSTGEDSITIKPPPNFRGAVLDPHGDHRMFMAFALSGLASEKGCVVKGLECTAVSYPGFMEDLRRLGATWEVVSQ